MNEKREVRKYSGFLNESSLSTDVEIDFEDIAKIKSKPAEEVRCSQNIDKSDDYDYGNTEIESEEKTDKSLDKIISTPRSGYISYTDAETIIKWLENCPRACNERSTARNNKPAKPKSYRDRDNNMVLLKAEVHSEAGRTIVGLGGFAKNINREAEPIGRYLLRALKATGALLKNNMLLILGVYDENTVQRLLNTLIDEYVACKRCRRFSNTSVSLISKMYRLKCHSCEDYRYLGRILYAPLNTNSRYVKK